MKDFDWEFPPWWAVPFMWIGGLMAFPAIGALIGWLQSL